MSTKALVAGISILLFASIIMGVVTTVRRSHDNKNNLSLILKLVSKFCSSIDYQESCYKTLCSANSTDPKMLIAKAILAVKEVVKKLIHYSNSLIVRVDNNSLTNMALDDCKDMMNYSVDSLQASYFDVNNSKIYNIYERVNDLRTWLSVVISYQQSCLDGFEHDSSMKETLQTGHNREQSISTADWR